MPIVDDALIGRVFREESGRSVATLIRIFGDIDLAEDAVQEAFTLALRKWPDEGLPPNPGAGSRRPLEIARSITFVARRAGATFSRTRPRSATNRRETRPSPWKTIDSA